MLVSSSLARVFLPEELEVTNVIEQGDSRVARGELLGAWKLYKGLLTEKKNIDDTVFETKPGIYQNAQAVILKKMAQILEHPKLPYEIQFEVEVFFKTLDFSTFFQGNEETRRKFIEKVRFYLPSKEGFKWFDNMGSIYLESGDCERALSLWEEAKDISLGYTSLNKKEKATFSAKLGLCYRQLGWHDKLKALFSENPKLTQLEGEEIVDGFDRITNLLKNLNAFAQTCPGSEIPSITQDFQIQRKVETINDEEFLKDELCFIGKVNWCFKKEKHHFLSNPLILGEAVYIVSVDQIGDDQIGNIYLLTLDKKTGALLNTQFIVSWPFLYRGHEFLYPYTLLLKDGKIQLTTEFTHHKFNLDGSIALAIDLTREEIASDIRNKYRYTLPMPNSVIARQLLEIYKDLPSEVQDDISQLFMSMKSTAIPELTKALSDSNENVRESAAYALGNLGEHAKEAVPELTKALSDSNEEVRARAAWALGEMGGHAKEAVPELTKALSDSNEEVRGSAAYALGNLGEHAKEAVPELAKALSDSNDWVRARTAHALENLGEHAKEAAPELAKALSDSDEIVRARAAEALGTLGEHAKEAAPELAKALSDSDKYVRARAAWALGKMGGYAKEAVPELTKALSDSNENVRARAAEALRNMGRSILPKLKEIQKNTNTPEIKKIIEQIEAQ